MLRRPSFHDIAAITTTTTTTPSFRDTKHTKKRFLLPPLNVRPFPNVDHRRCPRQPTSLINFAHTSFSSPVAPLPPKGDEYSPTPDPLHPQTHRTHPSRLFYASPNKTKTIQFPFLACESGLQVGVRGGGRKGFPLLATRQKGGSTDGGMRKKNACPFERLYEYITRPPFPPKKNENRAASPKNKHIFRQKKWFPLPT